MYWSPYQLLGTLPDGNEFFHPRTVLKFKQSLSSRSNKQEGWLSPTERALVSAISLRHIIWLPHESHDGMPYVAFRFAAAGIWLRQESLRHILASLGYDPGTIAVNITGMERGFNACQTHRSMYPSHVIDIGCPSVCPSHAGIVSKRLNLSSNCLHYLVAP